VFIIGQKDNNIFLVLPCEVWAGRFYFLAEELVTPLPNAQMDFDLRSQSVVGLLAV
jgi:hypothetical protein